MDRCKDLGQPCSLLWYKVLDGRIYEEKFESSKQFFVKSSYMLVHGWEEAHVVTKASLSARNSGT
jgi:hypothetical protein